MGAAAKLGGGKMITPIPIIINQNPALCPNCHAGEYKIEVCKHCGYKYPQDSLKWYEHLLAILALLGLAALAFAVMFFFIAVVVTWADGHLSLVASIAKVAKEFWKVLSNIY